MTTLNEPKFQTNEEARAFLEAIRWPDGPVCPHCGSVDHAYAKSKPGVYRCAEKECRKDFTVTTKSVMESSHIPLRLWVQAFHLMCSSKKGISAHQLHRTLKVTYKTAWFLAHRIREAMRTGGLGPLGGDSPQRRGRPYNPRGSRGPKGKRPIVALVERGGNVRTFHVPVADKETVTKIVRDNIAHESRLHTDESRLYSGSGQHFASHETVTHSREEYVRGDVHTNTAEGYFSIFKRGMRGVYQHCDEKHLHRYLAEFDFRYNHRVKLGYNDGDRATLAIKNAENKRLTYRQPD
jgi:transposase-like protein